MQKVTITRAAELLAHGHIGVIETDSIYGIAADLHKKHAVQQGFSLKHRTDKKPLPILAADLEQLSEIVILNRTALHLAHKFWLPDREPTTPVTLIVSRNKNANIYVTPTDSEPPETLAIRVIPHGFAHELLSLTGALAVTSANVSEMRNASSIVEIATQFASNPIATDLFYCVNRETLPSNTASTILNTVNVNKTAQNYAEIDGFGVEVVRE
jgi:tRNA threonylcarbamoyl adenosine modification protein (Sua5/YciO/YrdC/YwlC family)